jgi:hypothetical protein
MPLRAEIPPPALRPRVPNQAAEFRSDALADLAKRPDLVIVCAFAVIGVFLWLSLTLLSSDAIPHERMVGGPQRPAVPSQQAVLQVSPLDSDFRVLVGDQSAGN